MANVPKNMFNVGLDWGYHHFHAHVDGKYISSQYVNQQFAGTSTSQTIPPYFLLNLGVEDTIPVHADYVKNVQLALNIDNLLNRRYFPKGSSNTDYYGNTYLSVLEGMPRFVFGSVTVKF
ncbi:TonB-dependent receptor [Acidithiobacillus ferrooxidans]|uniref:TonB-dependent receptor domain-containing protein n=1 Tax=Acidithiobacillus ferrooxidans TaxID=920 RepID=UPI001EF22546|nr:TonB-dependent receptor [Acidithiobacillus ferrooxidans]MCR2829207.1 TonB-dependent receptor [Acidithiobacillus ferrooxidans]MDA8152094.1 TonB-dependent receptor [Acidithiobacillus sp.]